MAESAKIDPIEQFQIEKIVDFSVFGRDVSITNSTAFMALAVALILALMLLGTSRRALVPGRLQSVAEMLYEFVESTLTTSAGREGMRFFPLVFSLFMFVLFLNVVGIIPYTFTPTSHIIVTFALAMLVFLVVVVYGFLKHGTHFLGLFVPEGVPGYVLPLVVIIEVISFLSRPISLSVRLFANMLAGHITLKVFAAFVGSLLAAGAWGVLSPLPLVMAVALTALELLVAVLQAYVFTILTCIYLNDALHPGH